MSTNTQLFTEEQLDFIREMMNIGAGNAAALSLGLDRTFQRGVAHPPSTKAPVIMARGGAESIWR